ncbi:MAG: NlpC/P60 family protein [Actinomycetota bacterium]
MPHTKNNARGRIGRLIAAAALVLSVLVVVPATSSAVPTEDAIEDAKARYAELNQELSRLVEEYNAARVELDRIEGALDEARDDEIRATAQAGEAIELLEGRVTGAYMEAGSELEVLFEAGDFGDFSDRLEFLDQLQQQDADLAAEAENASQQAQWAQDELDGMIERQRELQESNVQKQNQINSAIEAQRDMISDLEQQLQREQQLAREAAQAAAEAALAGDGGDGGGAPAPPSDGGGNPPINGTGAAAAVSAAKNVLGTQYVWGGASPSGFDCSGLTMWSWAHGGVSLPHSSSAQYAATPRVDRGSVQPGDLLFFYSPISHVSMYIGGNAMIDASHPGPGGQVKIQSVYWGSYVGAGRPG